MAKTLHRYKYPSKRRRTQKNMHSKQNGSAASYKMKSKIIKTFMELLTMIKLYHWKTHSYAQHKATDDLHEKLSEHIDKFVEVLMGKTNSRIYMIEQKMRMYDFNTKQELRTAMFEYREFLSSELDRIFNSKKDSDILSIRDDMLTDINQFLYLLTFDR
jgi:hypothetical protein